MAFDISNTLIETDKWEEVRRKLYFPKCEDEYRNSSKPLTDFTKAFLSEVLPNRKQPLKEGYIADLCRDGSISPCALILGLIYIQRLACINPAYLSTVVPSDLFLTAMVVASKYLQDEGESEALVNSEWSAIGQKKKLVLDKLEKEFLVAIDWNLYVHPHQYDQFTTSIEGRIACIEAGRRGWWSYTDLISYWNASPTTDLMTSASAQTAKTVSGSMATYLLCFTALVSASNVAMETSSTSLVDPNLAAGSSRVLLNTNTNMDSNGLMNSSPLYSKTMQDYERVRVGTHSQYQETTDFVKDIRLGDALGINRTQIKGHSFIMQPGSFYRGWHAMLSPSVPYQRCGQHQEFNKTGFYPTINKHHIMVAT